MGLGAQAGGKNPKERELLLFGLFASTFAVLVARILALTLPFRVRPLQNPLLDFKLPHSMDPNTLIGWSSFPSDHAVLFFCLAMSLWLVSKRLGAVALVYALLSTTFPPSLPGDSLSDGRAGWCCAGNRNSVPRQS